MRIKNVKIYMEDHIFREGSVEITEGKIEKVLPESEKNLRDADELDGKGAYLIPGLIDLHFHGCMGADFCDGTTEAIKTIAGYEASIGVTAIAPATMTLPVSELQSILETAAAYRRDAHKGAELVGINMEGPFISPVKKGAQDDRNILACDKEIAYSFLKASEGLVRFIGIAPEESEESLDFIREMKEEVSVSLAHTNASYDCAKAAFESGANHVTHLFNAMPPFQHRDPGVVGAAMDSDSVMVELICDGIHLHPSMIRAAFRMFGEKRIILISDSMRATGLADGIYTLGGLAVNVRGKRATLVSDGAIAGSVTNLMDCLRYAVREAGVSLESAVACASENPAKSLGIFESCGSITAGKQADLVLLGEDLELIHVIKEGKIIE